MPKMGASRAMRLRATPYLIDFAGVGSALSGDQRRAQRMTASKEYLLDRERPTWRRKAVM